MELKLDLLDGMDGRLTTDGWEFDRIAIVTGVTGDGHAKILTAAGVTGFPSIGDAHPSRATCLLRDVETVESTHNLVKFRLHYADFFRTVSVGGYRDEAVQSGASVIQVSTNRDINGNDIKLTYTYPAGYQRSPHDTASESAVTIEQGGFVSALRPQATKIYQKTLSYDPFELAATYVGKINSNTWKGFGAKKMLCTGIRGVSDDGTNYKTTFEFQYNSKTWVGEIVFIKDDGKPPDETDANSERSLKFSNAVEIQEQIAFSGLPI